MNTEADKDFKYLKECVNNNNQYVSLRGNLYTKDTEEFEKLLSKLSNENTELYVHGFNYGIEDEDEDMYLISVAKGISGNKNIKSLTYARMHMHSRALPYYMELLSTNPNTQIDFIQENIEIDLFRNKQSKLKTNNKIDTKLA